MSRGPCLEVGNLRISSRCSFGNPGSPCLKSELFAPPLLYILTSSLAHFSNKASDAIFLCPHFGCIVPFEVSCIIPPKPHPQPQEAFSKKPAAPERFQPSYYSGRDGLKPSLWLVIATESTTLWRSWSYHPLPFQPKNSKDLPAGAGGRREATDVTGKSCPDRVPQWRSCRGWWEVSPEVLLTLDCSLQIES